MRLLGWCWDHRSTASYRAALAGDYQFAFTVYDTSQHQFVDRQMSHDEELTAAVNLFERGTAKLQPATHITFEFDPNLVAMPDSRTGVDTTTHRQVDTWYSLDVDTNSGSYRVTGILSFYLARGDAAAVPPEQARADRWFIERIEERLETPAASTPLVAAATGPLRAQPVSRWWWWQLKELYLS